MADDASSESIETYVPSVDRSTNRAVDGDAQLQNRPRSFLKALVNSFTLSPHVDLTNTPVARSQNVL
jgi:hypothetical protein